MALFIKNLVVGLAKNLRLSDQLPAAIELLESIKHENNLSSRYWLLLVDSYKTNRQNDDALVAYGQAVKAKPDSYILRVGYISLLETLQKYGKALAVTKQAHKDFPHDNNLMSTLAYLELANNNIDAAKEQLAVLKMQGVSNFLVFATYANIAMIERDYEQATILYKDIYKETPTAHNAINLARALQSSKQNEWS